MFNMVIHPPLAFLRCLVSRRGARLTLSMFMVCLVTPLVAQDRFLPPATAVVLPVSVHAAGSSNAAVRELDTAWRADPQNLQVAMAYARAVFSLGLNQGDLRWYGTAKAAMTPWWTKTDLPPDAYFLRGLVKQGFHEFEAGSKDIERAIALEPGRAEFWSWRFAIHLLLADLSAARQDTQEMERLFGREEADVYRAVLMYRSGQASGAIKQLSAAMRLARFQDASSQDWLGFHLGEALRVAGQPDRAVEVWRQRLKLNPQSHLLRLSLADVLNQQGRFAQAKTVAMGLTNTNTNTSALTDALLMQAVLASRGLKATDEERLASQMDARLKSQAQRQEAMIERPQLIYQIAYGQDTAAGLALSVANWQLQKEPPDAVLFAQAALAQGRARVAEPVVTWAEKTAYTDPQLTPLIAQLKQHPSWTGGKP